MKRRNIHLGIILASIAILNMGCLDFQATDFQQINKGFLTFGSGYGITEGISIDSYSTEWEEGYILLGNTDNGNDRNYYLVKTDTSGNIIWSISYGDLHVDNQAKHVLVEDEIIYILGDQYEPSLDRVIPTVSAFNISGEREERLDINLKDSINPLEIYEEKSAGFLLFENNRKVIVSTSLNVVGGNTVDIYLIDEVNEIEDIAKIDFVNTQFPDAAYEASNIKKIDGENAFYIVSTQKSKSTQTSSFLITLYYINEDTGELEDGGFWFYSVPYLSEAMDFEIIEGVQLIILNKSPENTLWADIVFADPDYQGQINIDEDFKMGKIAEEDDAHISKFDNSTYLVSSVKAETYAVVVDKLIIDDNGIGSDWDDVWNQEREFNNVSANYEHVRNNVGNAIPRIGPNGGVCLIGTHDFIDETKMMLMQLDNQGYYIRPISE